MEKLRKERDNLVNLEFNLNQKNGEGWWKCGTKDFEILRPYVPSGWLNWSGKIWFFGDHEGIFSNERNNSVSFQDIYILKKGQDRSQCPSKSYKVLRPYLPSSLCNRSDECWVFGGAMGPPVGQFSNERNNSVSFRYIFILKKGEGRSQCRTKSYEILPPYVPCGSCNRSDENCFFFHHGQTWVEIFGRTQ